MAEEDEGSFALGQAVVVIREKLWLIVLCALLGLFGGFAYAKHLTHTFMAVAVVETTVQPVKVVNFDDMQQANAPVSEMSDAVVAGFRNHAFLEHVVLDNHLLESVDFLPPAGSGQPPTLEQAVNVLAALQHVEVRHGTPFIDVGVQHFNPHTAQVLANALAQGYIRQSIRQRGETSDMAIEFLQGEANKLREQVQTSEVALQDYIRKTKSMSLQEKQDTVITKLKNLNEQYLEAKSTRLRLEADMDEMAKSAGQPQALLNIASVANHPLISGVKQQIAELEGQISTLALRYTEEHPKMIAARTQLADAKANLATSLSRMPALIKSNYESAVATEQKFEAAQKEQEGAAMELNDQAIPYKVLSRDVESNRALYDAILKRLKETEISKGIEVNNAHIFEPASLPTTPLQPGRMKILGIATALGVALGLALAFTANAMDSSLKTVEQAEQVTRLKVLGAIPRSSPRDLGDNPYAVRNPASPVAEAFRSLRASIRLVNRERIPRVVLFTSANPGEGKTFCAINYATSLAQQGLRTLLIDADLRVPKIARLLLPGAAPQGLSDYLEDPKEAEASVHPTELPHLFVVPAGTAVSYPAELLSRPSFAQMLVLLRENYHCIVIDTAPLLAVSDTLLLLEHADLTCQVVRAGKTPRKEILRAEQMLTHATGQPPALIVNGLPQPRQIGAYADRYGSALPASYASRPKPAGLLPGGDPVSPPS